MKRQEKFRANFTPFNAADYLDSDEGVAACLSVAIDDGNPDLLLTAIRDVVRALSVTLLAESFS